MLLSVLGFLTAIFLSEARAKLKTLKKPYSTETLSTSNIKTITPSDLCQNPLGHGMLSLSLQLTLPGVGGLLSVFHSYSCCMERAVELSLYVTSNAVKLDSFQSGTGPTIVSVCLQLCY